MPRRLQVNCIDMNDKPKSKWYWRLLRWGLIGLAVLATLAAVLITEENWRGKHDWEAYKRAAEARGEWFDWSFLVPTNLPDSENFVKAPIFSSLTNMVWDEKIQDWNINATNTVDRLKMSPTRSDGSEPEGVGGSWQQARLTRLENWQNYYRKSTTNGTSEFPMALQRQSPAADVLLALSKYDSVVEELRTASQRPYSRLGEYDAEGPGFSWTMTYLARLKGCAQVLQLRAIAELDDNQTAKALDDVKLLLRLDDELRQEPLLISHLVSMSISAITLQPIYEGLAQHRWNDSQLAELEQVLAAKDFLADFEFAMRGERSFAVNMLENERVTREYKTMQVNDGKPKEITISMRLMPSAYFYQNELALARLNEEFLRPLADVTNHMVSPAALRQAQATMERQTRHYSLYKMHALLIFPAISRSVEKFAHIQEDVDLARVACALERYRLANGSYPETLDALSPQFIEKVPPDIIGGQPLHYRRTDDGKFILYSVGWNEKDDGGMVVFKKGSTSSTDSEKGDWVWKY